MKNKTNQKVSSLVVTGVMAAVIGAVAPFGVSAGKISFTLCTLILYLSPYLLGWKRAAAATLVYIFLGMVGLPVFSGFRGGAAVLAGPTGGYLLGYIPMVILTGLTVKWFPQSRMLQLAGMIFATGVLYAFGTGVFCLQMDTTLEAAFVSCVYPFLLFDLAKIAAAVVLGPILGKRLEQAGLTPEG